MEFDRGGDDHGVKAHAVEHVVKIEFRLHLRIERGQMLEAVFADVTHHLELALRQSTEIAHQIRPPVAAAHNA
jgi:hypothetical protein